MPLVLCACSWYPSEKHRSSQSFHVNLAGANELMFERQVEPQKTEASGLARRPPAMHCGVLVFEGPFRLSVSFHGLTSAEPGRGHSGRYGRAAASVNRRKAGLASM